MIDEELYQQAADELNSDRRRPHIWARACALASDDHDEARYLYTNLRVEELLAEQAKGLNEPINRGVIENDATLALTPIDDGDDDDNDGVKGFLDDMELADGDDDIPSAVNSPSGIDQANLERLDMLELEMDTDERISSVPVGTDDNVNELDDPDSDLMADYVPESHVLLDDTYADDGLATSGLPEEEFAKELETFKAEHDDTSDLGSLVGADPVEANDFDLDSTTSLNLSADDIAQIQSQGSTPENATTPDIMPFEDLTGDFTDLSVDVDDLTQSNIDVLDANTSELDDMLEDARYKPAEPQPTDPDLEWMEQDSLAMGEAQKPAEAREPAIIDSDPLTDELSRQADEMDLADSADQTAVFSMSTDEQPAESPLAEPTLTESEQFESEQFESEKSESDRLAADSVETELLESDSIEHDPIERDPIEPEQVADELLRDEDIVVPESAPADEAPEPRVTEVAATATAAAAAAMVATSPDLSSAGTQSQSQSTEQGMTAIEYPLDLTEGRDGTLYSVYQRNNHSQAVKSGVSWSALLMTLPYLIYRQLFGTALAYIVLWVVAIGGLVVTGLAWLDAGANVTPLIQAGTIGFALMAFIGLIYLPFRYANSWRGEKLERRGFELIALAKAKNPGRAIASTRRSTAMDSSS